MSIPGTCCDHCDRPAGVSFGRWSGGAASVGEYIITRECDYHLGDPPGSIPGRCWSCGQPFKQDQKPNPWPIHKTVVRGHDISSAECVWVANFHAHCPDFADLPRTWAGPRRCCNCEHPIGYGQDYNSHHQHRFNRTLYSHGTCPDK